MGLFDKILGKDDDDRRDDKDRPAANFSDVRSGKPAADFSDVRSGSSSTATPVEHERSYTVVAGDSLSAIAKREYGDASKWHAIYDANKDQISNPDLIHPGQKLRLPGNP